MALLNNSKLYLQKNLNREVTAYGLLLWPFDANTLAKISQVMSETLPEMGIKETYDDAVVYKGLSRAITFVKVQMPYRREATLVHVAKGIDWPSNEEKEKLDAEYLLDELMERIWAGPKGGCEG